MAAAELQGGVKVLAPLDWELMPLEGVGPLRFGMRITDVAAVLPGMHDRAASVPGRPLFGALGVEFGMGHAKPAVYAYFIDDRLFCVAVDEVHGPQLTLWGRELTAFVPADLERFLLQAHWCEVVRVSYGLRGNWLSGPSMQRLTPSD
ncbi:hypothetical protein [Streptomyces sp. NPDC101234]|uniref:hypothetical protein n=1 Tax=Streptomyces sp. NPDC101234 TaxID=3366138 RepID=UPI003815E583